MADRPGSTKTSLPDLSSRIRQCGDGRWELRWHMTARCWSAKMATAQSGASPTQGGTDKSSAHRFRAAAEHAPISKPAIKAPDMTGVGGDQPSGQCRIDDVIVDDQVHVAFD